MTRPLVICLMPLFLAACEPLSSELQTPSSNGKPREIQVSQYPQRIIGKWQSANRTLVFSKNGGWTTGTEANAGTRNWDLNANRLTLNFEGANGTQSAEYRLSDFTADSFTMTMDHMSEVFHRVK